MEAEEKKRETDKNVKRLQDEIMASIESIMSMMKLIKKEEMVLKDKQEKIMENTNRRNVNFV